MDKLHVSGESGCLSSQCLVSSGVSSETVGVVNASAQANVDLDGTISGVDPVLSSDVLRIDDILEHGIMDVADSVSERSLFSTLDILLSDDLTVSNDDELVVGDLLLKLGDEICSNFLEP